MCVNVAHVIVVMHLSKTHSAISLIHHKLEVLVASKDVGRFISKAINEIRKNSDIPGFRPGKATDTGVIAHIGEKGVLEHAAKLLMHEAFQEASKGLEKPPITTPEFEYDEPLQRGKDFKFTATYYVQPPDPHTLAREIAKKEMPDVPSPEDILPEGPPNIQGLSGNPISPSVLKQVPGLNLGDKFIPDPLSNIPDPGKSYPAIKTPELVIPDPDKFKRPIEVMPKLPGDAKVIQRGVESEEKTVENGQLEASDDS